MPNDATAQALLDLLHGCKLGACLQLLPEPAQQIASQQHQRTFMPSAMADDGLLALGEDVIMLPAMHTAMQLQGLGTNSAGSASSQPLLPGVHLSLLAGAAAPELLPAAASSSSSPMGLPGMSVWQLHIGLLPAALARGSAAAYAEDTARRPWQAQLLTVLQWLAPHWHDALTSTSAASSGDGSSCMHGHNLQEHCQLCQQVHQQSRVVDSSSASGSMQGHEAPGTTDTGSANASSAARQQAAAAFDAAELYAAVKPTGREPQESRQPWQLRPVLRPYQRRAVHWMLQQEQQGQQQPGEATEDRLHPLWRCVLAVPGSAALAEARPSSDRGNGSASSSAGGSASTGDRAVSLYINLYSGLVSTVRHTAPLAPKGGILADEMGLGKTVELLACILLNRQVSVHNRPTHMCCVCACFAGAIGNAVCWSLARGSEHTAQLSIMSLLMPLVTCPDNSYRAPTRLLIPTQVCVIQVP